jgi:3-hydroxyacyl-CoA dehydrogenase/enoyl-CoA hydratase/3-hydroxybutyryl-CoA epimerase
LLPKKLSVEQIEALDIEEMKQRFLVTQAAEAARTFEEGVVTDVREADVGSIIGFGFAPFTGGTLSYIDMMGPKRFATLCEKLEKKFGPRFEAPKIVLDLAASNETFYGRYAPKSGRAAA